MGGVAGGWSLKHPSKQAGQRKKAKLITMKFDRGLLGETIQYNQR